MHFPTAGIKLEEDAPVAERDGLTSSPSVSTGTVGCTAPFASRRSAFIASQTPWTSLPTDATVPRATPTPASRLVYSRLVSTRPTHAAISTIELTTAYVAWAAGTT